MKGSRCAPAVGACHVLCRQSRTDCKCTSKIRLARWALPVTNNAPFFESGGRVSHLEVEARVARSHRWTLSHVTCGAQIQHEHVSSCTRCGGALARKRSNSRNLTATHWQGHCSSCADRVFVFFGAPATNVNTRAPRNCSWHKQVDTLVRWLAEFLAWAKERDCNTSLRH